LLVRHLLPAFSLLNARRCRCLACCLPDSFYCAPGRVVAVLYGHYTNMEPGRCLRAIAQDEDFHFALTDFAATFARRCRALPGEPRCHRRRPVERAATLRATQLPAALRAPPAARERACLPGSALAAAARCGRLPLLDCCWNGTPPLPFTSRLWAGQTNVVLNGFAERLGTSYHTV